MTDDELQEWSKRTPFTAAHEREMATEIISLREEKRELLQIAKLFADYGQCQAADEHGDCIHIDGVCEWHSAEHMWESFCMSRGL